MASNYELRNAPQAFAHEMLDVGTSALPMTPATAAAATRAIVSVWDQPAAYLYSGGTPTATVGLYAPAGSTFVVDGPVAIANFKIIRTGGTNARVGIQYLK